MPITCTYYLRGISPYSQSKPHLEEEEPGESKDLYLAI
jgi:hypothetical protein